MKPLFFLLTLSLVTMVTAAQSVSREEKAFLKALNQLASNSQDPHWRYEEPMKADSLFHFIGDSITITWKLTTDSSWIRRRIAAPLAKVESIDWDHYLIMNTGEEDVVRIYEQSNEHPQWQLVEKTNLFHIAAVSTENEKEKKWKQRIEKAFDRISKPNKNDR